MKSHTRGRIAAALAAVAVSTGLVMAPAASAAVQVSYSGSFSGTQGSGGWSYLEQSGTTTRALAYNSASANWGSTVGSQYLTADRNYLHPAATADVVVQWTAPSAGYYRVTGNVSMKESGGNGVQVQIRQGSTKVWPSGADWERINSDDQVGYAHNVVVNMAAGEKLSFVVNAAGDASYDSTIWNPSIASTTAPSTPAATTFASAFSGTQGSGGWSYKQRATDGTETPLSYNGTEWQQGDGSNFVRVAQGYLHPGNDGSQVEMTWTVPETGNYRITGRVAKRSDATSGDGVQARIERNSRVVWPDYYGFQKINANNTTGISHDFVIPANKGDVIRFVVDPGANSDFDSTVWNPTITPTTVPFDVTVQAPFISEAQLGTYATYGAFADNELGFIRKGDNQYDVYGTFPAGTENRKIDATRSTTGSATTFTWTNFPAPTADGNWRLWLNNVVRLQNGDLLALVHAENGLLERPGENVYYRLGLAYSKDNGATFRFMGFSVAPNITDAEVLAAPTGGPRGAANEPAYNTNITGGAMVFVNGYVYVYFADSQTPYNYERNGQLAVARASLNDVIAAGRADTNAPAFTKYYQSGWTQPGLGGKSSPLDDNNRQAHAQITYDSYIQKYVYTNVAENSRAISVKVSSDPLNWNVPAYIVEENNAFNYYTTNVGLGTDPQNMGQSFDLIYGATPGTNFLGEYARRTITFKSPTG